MIINGIPTCPNCRYPEWDCHCGEGFYDPDGPADRADNLESDSPESNLEESEE